jgi:hypothetical protein
MDSGIVGKSKSTLKRIIIVVGIFTVLSNSTKSLILPPSNSTKSQISNDFGLNPIYYTKKINIKSGASNFLLWMHC